jgi:predicted transcriptional regulator
MCMSNWTLFSNHGHVLVCLSRDSQARLRDVATDVGITERAVQKIVRDLQDVGMVSITKNGRRNSYRIHNKKPLRHDLEAACTLKDLIKFVNKDSGPRHLLTAEIESTKKPESIKTGTYKPKQSASKARQQRSLF